MTNTPTESPSPQEYTNIGLTERKVRLWLGVGMLGIAIALAVIFLATDTSRWWRLVLLVPTYQGIRFLYDSWVGVCPLKAELGQEKMTGFMTTVGTKISDQTRIDRIKQVSRGAMTRSVVGAAAFTVIMLLIP